MVSPGFTPADGEPAIDRTASTSSGTTTSSFTFIFNRDLAAMKFAASEADPLEPALGNHPDCAHYKAPEPRHIYNFGAFAIRRVNQVGGFGGRDRQQRALAAPGHARIDRAQLDRHHMHAAASQAPAQSLRKSSERALGCAVHVILLAAALAGDRSDHDDKAGALLFEMPRSERDQRYGAGEILMNRGQRLARVGLGGVLVAERAEAYDDAVEPAELGRGMADELVMRREIRRVEGARNSGHARTRADVLGHAPRLVGVAGGEEQPRAVGCESKRECARDRTGGAKNQNSIHLSCKQDGIYSVIRSLRDRLDEERLPGSATLFAACHLLRFGYIARNVSDDMRASLARYTRPPRFSTIASSVSRNSSKPSATGKSSASV